MTIRDGERITTSTDSRLAFFLFGYDYGLMLSSTSSLARERLRSYSPLRLDDLLLDACLFDSKISRYDLQWPTKCLALMLLSTYTYTCPTGFIICIAHAATFLFCYFYHFTYALCIFLFCSFSSILYTLASINRSSRLSCCLDTNILLAFSDLNILYCCSR